MKLATKLFFLSGDYVANWLARRKLTTESEPYPDPICCVGMPSLWSALW